MDLKLSNLTNLKVVVGSREFVKPLRCRKTDAAAADSLVVVETALMHSFVEAETTANVRQALPSDGDGDRFLLKRYQLVR